MKKKGETRKVRTTFFLFHIRSSIRKHKKRKKEINPAPVAAPDGRVEQTFSFDFGEQLNAALAPIEESPMNSTKKRTATLFCATCPTEGFLAFLFAPSRTSPGVSPKTRSVFGNRDKGRQRRLSYSHPTRHAPSIDSPPLGTLDGGFGQRWLCVLWHLLRYVHR